MGFRLVQKSVTLNDPERLNGSCFGVILPTEYGRFEAHYVKVVEYRPILSATKVYTKECSFQQYIIYGDIRRGYRERVYC